VERAIADRYGIDPQCVTVGAGSSDLIHRVLPLLLQRASRVFVFDPTYSEYRHVCTDIVGCRVEHGRSLNDLNGDYDLIVVVNPNNPTGEVLTEREITTAAHHLAEHGRIWVDEAYLPYVTRSQSMRSRASTDSRFVVCQSLSKSLALSGLRAAFMVSDSKLADIVRCAMPPWLLSTPAALAVTTALGERDYYESRYSETAELRVRLAQQLAALSGVRVCEGAANWVTLWVEDAAALIAYCKRNRVLLRDGQGMFASPPAGFVRVAVRSEAENARCLVAIRDSVAHRVQVL
jgi:histidinol-phosphate/aromatic aminotransferase/cobyric acid decarboxylase-like protein